jgi:hypothetical protein
MMWTPRISPVAASATDFTKPSPSPRMPAFELAVNGNFPTRTWRPEAFACASVMPTLATSGWQ